MDRLIVSVEELDGPVRVAVISLKGTIEMTNASSLEDALRRLMARDQFRFIVDLSDVGYISSAGWGIFIGELKRIRHNSGDIKLVGMTPEVREVFDLLEFDDILDSFSDQGQAIKDFENAAGAKASKS